MKKPVAIVYFQYLKIVIPVKTAACVMACSVQKENPVLISLPLSPGPFLVRTLFGGPSI